ncbi:hypothetical protein Clacol_006954 [Clathrus columnatus]|uniref:Uncharacterized protein n=1 Tax=Clathrus columnatus TaxID=1419009 RepID=A0AAV5AIP4_9AGAM|nr:hypothetical protein Clacol_006954 [Clathrus columnatus]
MLVRKHKYSDKDNNTTVEILKIMLELLGVNQQGFTDVYTHAYILLDEKEKFSKVDIDVIIQDESFAGESLLEFKVFPAMIFIGSLPAFYHIKVTKELADCVRREACPSTITYVEELCLPIEKEMMSYGLWHMHNRQVVMKIIENMKDFFPTGPNDIPLAWYQILSKQEWATMGGPTRSDSKEIVMLKGKGGDSTNFS